MPRIWRVVFALWLAGVFAVGGGTVVDAQRPPFEGALFWMASPAGHSGDLWLPPPVRGWNEIIAGDPWAQGTSFPTDRIWESSLAGMPPNDSCFPDGVDAVTDPDVGPYGLQTTQYFGDWWEGNVYVHHPVPPPGWSEPEYGGFYFQVRPPQNGHSRLAVAPSNGAPEQMVGSPGACVGGNLALQRGEQDGGAWMPHSLPGTSLPCYSQSQLFRFRLNTELRCEPDLADGPGARGDPGRPGTDPYTSLFWDIFDQRALSLPLFLDGTPGLIAFPYTYAGPYPLFRRVDVGFSKLFDDGSDSTGLAFPPTPVAAAGVFNVSAGSSALGARDDYTAATNPIHWVLGPLADVRSHVRNGLRAYDPVTGTSTDFVNIFDGFRDETDCLFFTAVTQTALVTNDMDSPCPTPDKSRMTAHVSLEAGDRVPDVGVINPAALPGPAPTVNEAHPRAQPFPSGSFWMDWTNRTLRCTERHAMLDPFYLENAEALIQAHQVNLDYWWDLYLNIDRSDFGPPEDFVDAQNYYYTQAQQEFAAREGWRAIFEYREGVVDLLEAAFAAAVPEPYVVVQRRDTSVLLIGSPFPASCEAPSFTLQPDRMTQGSINGPAWDGRARPPLLPSGAYPGQTTELRTLESVAAGMLSGTQTPEHYRGDEITVWRAGISRNTVGSDPYPEGPSHGAKPGDLDILDSGSSYVSFSCGSPEADVFAPDVTHITPTFTSVTPGQTIYTPRGEVTYQGPALDAPFEADALGNTCYRPDGTDCYGAPALAELTARYPGTRAAAALAAAVALGLPAGTAAGDELLGPFEHGHTPFRHRPTGRHSGSFVRETSGDLDADGNLLFLDQPSGRANLPGQAYRVPTAYAVQPLRFFFNGGFSLYLRTGLRDLDHRVLGGTGPGWAFKQTRFFGAAPGTHLAGPVRHPDVENMTGYGPVRYSGAMEAAKTGRVGTCTLCSEKGCDPSVLEDFPGERFTSRVTTAGRLVCLIQPGQTPPVDCPGP